MNIEQLKYPIGKFEKPETITSEFLKDCIDHISTFPARLRKEVDFLSEEQLDTPYREDGWTIRQVVNHCSDSHMNGLIRVKLALTEDTPVIKPYLEDRWAELADSKKHSIQPALAMLDGIHNRWGALLSNLSEEQLQRTFIHPSHGKEVSLRENTCHYAWHCNHHLAHITSLKERRGW